MLGQQTTGAYRQERNFGKASYISRLLVCSAIKAYLRSDEAGCYHNGKLVSSFRELGYRQKIEIVRYDHSEPQSGKDMCDRILCPIKAAIRRYCNEGHDVVSAQDMHIALKERPVKGTTATVCTVQEQYTTLEIRKIPNYSNLHNFEFTKEGLRVWKAFSVGSGKFIPWNDIVICPQRESSLMEESPFFLTTARQFTSKEQSRADISEDKLYECPEPSCNEEFQKVGPRTPYEYVWSSCHPATASEGESL